MTTNVPLGPLVGLRETDAPLATVKAPLALLVPSLTVTVFEPLAPEGTV